MIIVEIYLYARRNKEQFLMPPISEKRLIKIKFQTSEDQKQKTSLNFVLMQTIKSLIYFLQQSPTTEYSLPKTK